MIARRTLAALVAVALLVLAAGCTSAADRASENVSTAAENFEVGRLIVGMNIVTGDVLFSVEGRCSIERQPDALVVICKEGPDEFKKHYLGLSAGVTYVSTQLAPIEASTYHTRIILRPTTILPDFDLSVGQQ